MIDILIPTYNRSRYLEKNLKLICEQIQNSNLKEFYKIIISNNNSEDDTEQIISKIIISYPNIKIYYKKQEKNIGLLHNSMFLLRTSSEDYSMYLGDDDYLPSNYLRYLVEYLKKHSLVTCVIPGYYGINIEGKVNPGRRKYIFKTRNYNKGFITVARVGHFAHQLSGIVFRRAGVEESFSREYYNLYPFIYFASFNMERGKTHYVPEYQVKVTVGTKKDWKYDSYGLILDMINNYKLLYKDAPFKSLICIGLLIIYQPSRLMGTSIKKFPKKLNGAYKYIFKHEATSWTKKIFFTLVFFISIFSLLIQFAFIKIERLIGSNRLE